MEFNFKSQTGHDCFLNLGLMVGNFVYPALPVSFKEDPGAREVKYPTQGNMLVNLKS